ncbi:condensation domain-containing protein [Streptomyces sp. NPDC058955]|uniref:condensation domain-containing protein n=1 Tax=unclassified Streptomyces TaxID=2593676 RepID=UPI00364FB9D4
MTASFALSAAQTAVLELHRDDPSGHRQATHRGFTVSGPLDVPALRAAVATLVRRHEPLRTVYRGGPVPLQTVLPEMPAPVELTDVAARPHAFDLAHGPLLRVAVRPRGPHLHEVSFFLHLLAADGWSLRVFFAELAACYRAERSGRTPDLPELALDYVDWAAWQNGELTPERRAHLSAWWRNALEGYPVPTPGAVAGVSATNVGRRLSVRLESGLTRALRETAAARGHGLFSVLASACAVALSRHEEEDRLPLGLAVANRDRPEVAGLLGFFATLTVLPVDLRGNPAFADVVERVSRARTETYRHRELPLAAIAAAVAPGTPPVRALSLVRACFAHHPSGSLGTLRLDGCAVEELPLPDGARFPLMVRVEEHADDSCTVWGEFTTTAPPLGENEVRALLAAYRAVLEHVAATPDAPLAALRRTAREREQDGPGHGPR